MLYILLATCETALHAFAHADSPIAAGLVEDLENVVARARHELEARDIGLSA